MNDPTGESKPLVVPHVPVTGRTRRIHLCLKDCATPFSLEVFLASLCGAPCQVHPFWLKVGPEAKLSCVNPVCNSAFVRRVRQPAESENLLQDGVKINLLLYLVQSRVWARDLACPADKPGSGDCVLAKA